MTAKWYRVRNQEEKSKPNLFDYVEKTSQSIKAELTQKVSPITEQQKLFIF